MILLDGVPVELDALMQIHEDALIAWDRDIGEFVSNVEPIEGRAHVRVWWKTTGNLTKSWGCLAFVSISFTYLPKVFLVADGASVRWTTENPRKIGSTPPTTVAVALAVAKFRDT